jgi:hypothetical protein
MKTVNHATFLSGSIGLFFFPVFAAAVKFQDTCKKNQQIALDNFIGLF